MKIRAWAGIVVLIGTLAVNVRGAEPADADVGAANSGDLAKLRYAEDQWTLLEERVGPGNPAVLQQKTELDILRKRLLSRADFRLDRAGQELEVTNHDLANVRQQLRQV